MGRIGIYLKGLAGLAVLLMGFAWNARAQQAANLDVVGIKIGMPAKQAMLALKAYNPSFVLNPVTTPLEGFAQPLTTSVSGNQLRTATKGGEDIILLLTVTPGQESVWGIRRSYTYAASERPSMANTVEALRNKYGPESLQPSADSLFWVFDGQGKLLTGEPAKRIVNLCAAVADSRFNPNDAASELVANRGRPPECDSTVMAQATLMGGQSVNQLIVQITHGPMQKTSVDAARASALSAAKAREAKQAGEIEKRGAPKL